MGILYMEEDLLCYEFLQDFNAEAYYQSLDDTEQHHAKELLSSHVPFLLSKLKASLDSQASKCNEILSSLRSPDLFPSDDEKCEEQECVITDPSTVESPPSRCSVCHNTKYQVMNRLIQGYN